MTTRSRTEPARVAKFVIVAGITFAMLTSASHAALTKAQLKAERQAQRQAEREARQFARQQAREARQAERAAMQAARQAARLGIAQPIAQPDVPLVLVSSPPSQTAPAAATGSRGASPDLNNDGVVDAADVALFKLYFGAPFDPNGPSLDINGDGVVDSHDLFELLRRVGETYDDIVTPPSPSTPPGKPAPSSPPAPAPAVTVATTLVDGNKIEMMDVDTGTYIIKPNGQRLWSGSNNSNHPTSVSPSIQMVPVSNGFNVVYTFTNNTGAMAGLGKFTVGGFRFGQIIEAHDFRFDGKPYEINNNGGPIAPGGWFYPGGQYSPVVVFGEAPYKVGVSLHYPVLEYKHQVRLRIRTPGGAASHSGLNWAVEVIPNTESDPNKYNPQGDLHPGEVRVYVLAVRVVKGDVDWIHTLEPYRDYFQSLYGPVRYTRDARPVNARSAAQVGNQTSSNPYGFGHDTLRPDLYGWQPWADRFVNAVDQGWSRFMLWRPTGLFVNHDEMQNPFLFTSHWSKGAQYGHNMADAQQQLQRVSSVGGNLGLWWGSSVRVMRSWNTDEWEQLDPNNREHVALAFEELDGAVAAGVRTIGLDSFRRLQPWDAWQWLQMMQRRAPHVTFITEPPCGDLIHTLAPAFLVATRPANQLHLRLEQPHALADYLIPGHETWGLIRRDRLTSALGKPPTDAEVQAEVARVAGLGYIPCVGLAMEFGDGEGGDDRFMAAETWHLDD